MLSLSPPPSNLAPTAVIVTKDLFFGGQVTGTAAKQGRGIAMAMSLDALKDHLTTGTIRGLILDLASNIAPAEIIAVLPADTPLKTLAFGPHVHTDNLQAARDAGFQQVMPRSRFSAELIALLEWLTG